MVNCPESLRARSRLPMIDVKGVRNSWETVETTVVPGSQGVGQSGHLVIEQPFAFAAVREEDTEFGVCSRPVASAAARIAT